MDRAGTALERIGSLWSGLSGTLKLPGRKHRDFRSSSASTALSPDYSELLIDRLFTAMENRRSLTRVMHRMCCVVIPAPAGVIGPRAGRA